MMNPFLRKPKTIFLSFMGILILIVIFQNMDVVSFRFLFWEFQIARIILIPALILCGFIPGYVSGKRSHS